MSNKLGAILCWLLYLGTVRWLAQDALPFVAAALALALVFYIIVHALDDRERKK